jgi:hypothetical protein
MFTYMHMYVCSMCMYVYVFVFLNVYVYVEPHLWPIEKEGLMVFFERSVPMAFLETNLAVA